MPPWPSWWRGRETIAGFAEAAAEICAGGAAPLADPRERAARRSPTTSGTRRPAATRRAALDVLTLEGTLIKEITAFVTPELFPRFGLPPELPADEQLR